MKGGLEKVGMVQEKIGQLKAEQGEFEQEIVGYFVQVMEINIGILEKY